MRGTSSVWTSTLQPHLYTLGQSYPGHPQSQYQSHGNCKRLLLGPLFSLNKPHLNLLDAGSPDLFDAAIISRMLLSKGLLRIKEPNSVTRILCA